MRFLLAIAWAAAGAFGGEDAPAKRYFEEMDRDGDGKIVRAEWRGIDRGFDRLDLDRDGVLTLPEVVEARAQTGAPALVARLAGLDADGDRRIARAEWKGLAALFADFDRDKGGTLKRREFHEGQRTDRTEAMRAAFDERDKNKDGALQRSEWPPDGPDFHARDRDGDRKISRAEWAVEVELTFGGVRFFDTVFSRLDADKNGRVSPEEWAAIPRLFDGLDANKDGFLAPPEIPLATWPPRRTAYDVVRRYDRDRDGKVTRKEWRGDTKGFNKLDRNRDGVLTKDDVLK